MRQKLGGKIDGDPLSKFIFKTGVNKRLITFMFTFS